MVATLWTPNTNGIFPSIWEPGGQNVVVVCELAELTPIDYTEFTGATYLDNFTQPDGTDMSLNYPQIGPSGYSLNEGPAPLVLQGSLVTPAIDTLSSIQTGTYGANGATKTFKVDFGIFSQEAVSGQVIFYDAKYSEFNEYTMTISITTEDQQNYLTLAIVAQTDFGTYNAQTAAPVPVDYCTWYSLEVNFFSGTNTYTLNGSALEMSGSPDDIFWQSYETWDVSSVSISMSNAEANGMRFAAVGKAATLG